MGTAKEGNTFPGALVLLRGGENSEMDELIICHEKAVIVSEIENTGEEDLI